MDSESKRRLPGDVNSPHDGPQECDGTSRFRFGDQPCEQYPASYQLTEANREAVRSGRAVFIRGDALARLNAFAAILQACEGFVYLTASPANPELIIGILIPCQRASSCHCRVESDAVLAAGREARKRRLIIVGGDHTHGQMCTFSSGTDMEQVRTFAQEGIGWPGQRRRSDAVVVTVSEEGSLEAISPFDCGQRVVVRAKGLVPGQPVLIEWQRSDKSLASVFATTNARGDHWFPVIRSRVCPDCGGIGAMPVVGPPRCHIIGEVTPLSREEVIALEEEIERKVRRFSYASDGDRRRDGRDDRYGGRSAGQAYRTLESGRDHHDDCRARGVGPRGPAGGPPAFELWHRDRRVARVPAWVIEEAAAKVESLAAALGWDNDTSCAEAKDARKERNHAGGSAS